MSVVYQINCVGGITRTKHAHAQSQVLGCEFRLYVRAALAWMEKNVHLEMRNKANRASETEEQRKTPKIQGMSSLAL